MLEQLAAEAPQLAEAHQRLGLVLQIEGRLAEAEAAYRKALGLDPEYVAALIGLGEIEAQFGRPDSALQRFDAAIEIDPHQAKAHLAEGRVLEAIGRTDEALAAYFRTLELDPAPSRSFFGSPRSSSPETSPTRRWPGSTRRWSWPPTTPRPTISAAGRTWP